MSDNDDAPAKARDDRDVGLGVDVDVDAALDEIETSAVEPVALELEESKFFRGVHPIGWVSGLVLVAAVIFGFVIETDYQIGNFGIGLWALFIVLVALSVKPVSLHILRVAIERVASVTKTIAWILSLIHI